MTDRMRSKLNRGQVIALGVGLAGLAVCLVGALASRRQFFAAYLFGYLFWLGLALGCLGLVMIHHLTGGRWGFIVRRFLEAGFMTLPMMALLFAPVFFGLHELFPWARPETVATSEILLKKQGYLNVPGFTARAVFFFVVWIVMVGLLRKWSLQQDETDDSSPTRRLRTLSGPGIVVYPLTGTFAFVDWLMSLEPEWHSTLFLVIVLIGQIINAITLSILLLAFFKDEPPFASVATSTHFHHLGNLLLAFVMFWTYVSFSQLLIIYSGNLPREIEWFLHRIAGGWKWVALFLVVFHFLIPFLLLLFRTNKQRARPLCILAGLVFLTQVVNVFWFVMPSFHPTGFRVHWLDPAAALGIGGVWVAVFIAGLKRRPFLPQNDPRIEFGVRHESQPAIASDA